jgi:hypothetical protein
MQRKYEGPTCASESGTPITDPDRSVGSRRPNITTINANLTTSLMPVSASKMVRAEREQENDPTAQRFLILSSTRDARLA